MSEDESRHGPAQQLFLAKALYDNIAESPDELAFRRGDVITVLEQDTGGLDGWWLCSLRGRQGIAPGNRLKILSGMLDPGTSPGPAPSAAGGSSSRSSGGELLVLDNDVAAKKEWRRSLESSPTKVVTPVRKGDIYLYKQPNRSMEDYDVPPSRYFPSSKEGSPEPPTPTDLYDTPSSVGRYNSNSNLPASLYETPPSSKRASSERTPPGSNRASLDSLASSSSSLSSGRLSGDLLQHLYQTPPSGKRGSGGGERLYETPPGSKRASLERILSDDQPTYDTPSSASAALRPLDLSEARYDRPSGSRSAEPPGESTYDTPNPSSNASSRRQSRDSTGLGSRSSIMSTASSESGLSAGLGQGSNRLSSGALSLDSARSSLDASLHEPYDLPPRETRALKQLSCDSGLGLYDSPALGRCGPPPHAVSCSSRLSDYARGEKPFPQADILPRSKSVEQSIDHGEADYDLPRSNAPKIGLKSAKAHQLPSSGLTADPNAVYDIPPQVTRDSVISTRSDSSDDSLRLSTCSADSRGSGSGAGMEGLYEELLLDLDSALELLVKRQQDVTKAAAKLMAFVTPNWRTKESLQSRVYEIKVACGELKKTLVDFVYFAQGAVGNSARQADKKLISRLLKQLTPLEEERKKFSASLRALEDMKWQVALLVLPAEETLEQAKDDHLGKIVSLASDLIPEVKKLASVIQSHGPQLFKRSSELAASSKDKPPVVSKPPIGPKPEAGSKPFNLLEATKSAGGGSGVGVVIQRPRSVQSRPLPAPPTKGLSDRPLPPPPLQQKVDSTRDYVNVKPEEEDDGDRDYSDLQQEYDYVQLQSCDVIAQKQQMQQQKMEQTEEAEKEELPQPPPTDPGTSCENLQSIEEEPDTPTPTRTRAQCPELSEEASAPTRHTTRVSADLGIRVTGVESAEGPGEDVDLVPSKESDHGAPSLALHAQPLEADWGEELMTPVNKTNGFKIPSQLPPPSAWPALHSTALEPNDKQVLCYYSGQLETHSTLLTNAIDAFFNCIESNEPPKVFISNSKFVIVTAHKLVYIGDALHRSLANVEVRNKVMSCANHVCECLKVSVQATKVAALQWPSVAAVQEMVDRVVDVSHAAHELKLVITQASSL